MGHLEKIRERNQKLQTRNNAIMHDRGDLIVKGVVQNSQEFIDIEKGKRVPIGTVTNGYKKVAEGKWVAAKKAGKTANGNVKGEDKSKSSIIKLKPLSESPLDSQLRKIAGDSEGYTSGTWVNEKTGKTKLDSDGGGILVHQKTGKRVQVPKNVSDGFDHIKPSFKDTIKDMSELEISKMSNRYREQRNKSKSASMRKRLQDHIDYIDSKRNFSDGGSGEFNQAHVNALEDANQHTEAAKYYASHGKTAFGKDYHKGRMFSASVEDMKNNKYFERYLDKLPSSGKVQIVKVARDTSGKRGSQDQYEMKVLDAANRELFSIGTHPSGSTSHGIAGFDKDGNLTKFNKGIQDNLDTLIKGIDITSYSEMFEKVKAILMTVPQKKAALIVEKHCDNIFNKDLDGSGCATTLKQVTDLATIYRKSKWDVERYQITNKMAQSYFDNGHFDSIKKSMTTEDALDILIKGERTGYYQDNSQNRKAGKVGQKYSKDKQDDPNKDKKGGGDTGNGAEVTGHDVAHLTHMKELVQSGDHDKAYEIYNSLPPEAQQKVPQDVVNKLVSNHHSEKEDKTWDDAGKKPSKSKNKEIKDAANEEAQTAIKHESGKSLNVGDSYVDGRGNTRYIVGRKGSDFLTSDRKSEMNKDKPMADIESMEEILEEIEMGKKTAPAREKEKNDIAKKEAKEKSDRKKLDPFTDGMSARAAGKAKADLLRKITTTDGETTRANYVEDKLANGFEVKEVGGKKVLWNTKEEYFIGNRKIINKTAIDYALHLSGDESKKKKGSIQKSMVDNLKILAGE